MKSKSYFQYSFFVILFAILSNQASGTVITNTIAVLTKNTTIKDGTFKVPKQPVFDPANTAQQFVALAPGDTLKVDFRLFFAPGVSNFITLFDGGVFGNDEEIILDTSFIPGVLTWSFDYKY